MLNAIGLQGIGVHRYITEKLPELRRLGATNVINICGSTLDEYVELARILSDAEGVHALELNISCPNIKEGGITFGCSLHGTFDVVSAVKKVTRLPVIPKLTPNVTDVASIAKAAEDAGADAVSLVNTFLAMAIDVETRRPKLSNIVGGLSGPAIRPIAVRMVYECRRAVKIPVIGMGGIATATDALEFMIAGATAVQVGTANFVDPFIWTKLLDGMRDYMTRHQHRAARRSGRHHRYQHTGKAVGQLLVALDVDSGARALELATQLRDLAGGFKVGSRLFTPEGPDSRQASGGIRRPCLPRPQVPRHSRTRWRRRSRPRSSTGVWMLNVHASGGVPMMQAAARAAADDGRHGRPPPAARHRRHRAHEHGRCHAREHRRAAAAARAGGDAGADGAGRPDSTASSPRLRKRPRSERPAAPTSPSSRRESAARPRARPRTISRGRWDRPKRSRPGRATSWWEGRSSRPPIRRAAAAAIVEELEGVKRRAGGLRQGRRTGLRRYFAVMMKCPRRFLA